jgi:hypothetical protein
MFGFLGRLFGTAKGMDTALGMVDKTVGGVISGIDAAFYTKEEKAKDIATMVFKLQDQFTPRAISRRLIAFMFTSIFCIAFIVALVFTCLEKYAIVNAIIKLIVAFKLPIIILSVIVFYFGYYGWKQIKGGDK